MITYIENVISEEVLDKNLDVGRRLGKLPLSTLSCVELAEVFAYCLIQYGRAHSKTNLVYDEINTRQKIIDGLKCYAIPASEWNSDERDVEDDEEYDELYRGDRW